MCVKVGRKQVLKPAPKHALKVHVWAGILKRGSTHICIFDQIMNGPLYVKILEDHLLPFLDEHFHSTEYRFTQDNDPKPTSRVAKAFYVERGSIGGQRLPAALILIPYMFGENSNTSLQEQ